MQRKMDPRRMRQINGSGVLRLLREGGPLSRTQLAERSRMAKPTVGAIVDELLGEGLINEVGLGEATAAGGRRPRLLEFNDASVAYLGVKFGVTRTTVGVADGRGRLISVRSRPALKGDPKRSVQSVRRLALTALQAAEIPFERLEAVGVSVPGSVDTEGVCSAGNLQWRDFPLREAIESSIGLPTVVRDNADVAVLAEAELGAATSARTFVRVYLGSGIGAGIVIDREMFVGSSGASGQVGHCCVVEDGPECVCGQRGCLEAVASAAAVVRDVQDARRSRGEPAGALDAAEVCRLALEGDEIASAAVRRAAAYIGRGISYLVNILNPELVVIGGVLASAGPVLLDEVQLSLGRHLPGRSQVPVAMTAFGDEAELQGAVLLAMGMRDKEAHLFTPLTAAVTGTASLRRPER